MEMIQIRANVIDINVFRSRIRLVMLNDCLPDRISQLRRLIFG